ncbi:MAG: 4-(cytidine 5'-diphospho)-2-C-methyl-D-erythritol kinase [Candidatus Humimicrobiaceae bacterium]
MICELAPAKVNLTLEVLDKRNDGYHEIESLMQTIDICDVLTLWDNEWVQVIPEYCNLPSHDSLSGNGYSKFLFDNLVYKAALLLKQETGYGGGALIQLKKNIPSSAGLGGGSSDAAATLKGLNKLWGLGLSKEDLAEIGSRIGSDVPYFIYGGTCLVKGRGEKVKPLENLNTKWLVVIPLPICIREKTSKLYSYIKPAHYSRGKVTGTLIKELKNGSGTNGFRENLFNVFEIVYNDCFNEFNEWIGELENMGITPLHLAGSGPAVYYISESREKVRKVIESLTGKENLSKYLARTVP